ncbi:tail fiber protein [Salmonella phage SeKF_19]
MGYFQMTRNVEELFGGVITAPHQIPFTYKSNVGGETFLSLPFHPVTGVITINGGMQVPLDNFEIEGNTLNLGRALSKGDVVYCLFDKILSPEDTAKGIRIYKFQAVGGETEFTPDFTSYGVQSLYIGGEYKTPEIEYSYNSTTGKVSLQTALTAGVWVVAEMSVKQPNISPLFDRSVQEIARSANVKDSEVIISTDTTQVLNGKKVIFSVNEQKSYGLPTLPTNVYIQSVANGKLTYNPGSVIIDLLAPPSAAVEDIKAQLLQDTGTGMVGTKLLLAGAVYRSLTSKLGDSISVTDFGAKGDGATDDTASFQAAIQAAKLSPYIGKGVFVPAGTYCVSGVVLDCGILLHGEGKSCSILRPLTDGATCLHATVEMAIIEQLEFRSLQGKESQSTGISIEAPLITVSDCAFTFLKHGIITPSGKGAGELIIRHNRFAASGFGAALLGGNINTLFLQNTFSDCNIGLFSTDEAASGDVKKITEGITLNGDRFYACGNASADQSAIEVIDTRWITLNSVMSDLAYGNAFRATNVKHVRITGGYYSSNHSTNKSCMVIRGECDNFLLDGTMLSDSRFFCLEVYKYQGNTPKNAVLDKVVFQLNNIDPSQTGDLLVNSASLIASKCSFQSDKAGSITIIDNETGGSKVTTHECAFAGGVQLGVSTCKFSSKDSPTHPDFQAGIVSIASGSSEVTVPLTTQAVSGATAVGIFTVNAIGKNEPVWGDVTGGGLLIKQATTNPTTIAYTYQLVYA